MRKLYIIGLTMIALAFASTASASNPGYGHITPGPGQAMNHGVAISVHLFGPVQDGKWSKFEASIKNVSGAEIDYLQLQFQTNFDTGEPSNPFWARLKLDNLVKGVGFDPRSHAVQIGQLFSNQTVNVTGSLFVLDRNSPLLVGDDARDHNANFFGERMVVKKLVPGSLFSGWVLNTRYSWAMYASG